MEDAIELRVILLTFGSTVGAQRPLELSDLYDIAPRDSPVDIARRLKDEWNVRQHHTESWWALARYIACCTLLCGHVS